MQANSYICTSSSPTEAVLLLEDSLEAETRKALVPYCSLVPTPRQKWRQAKRYSVHDIVFIIFTGAKFYHTRATAARDTWLSRVHTYYFLGETPYPFLPVTVIEDAGADNLSNMKKIFYGLQIIYKQQQAKPLEQRQKWFYIAGCDTYVNTEHVLKRLEPYNHNTPLLIGGHSASEMCYDAVTQKTHPITFPSGGAGFFISIRLFEMIEPYLTNYVESIWPRTSPASDVAIACLAFKLGVRLTEVSGFWAFPPAQTLIMNGIMAFHNDTEPNTYHYVTPSEMHLLDEFYIHQYIDRLVNDNNWLELTKFVRRFVTSHYKLLSIKRQECKLPDY